MGLVKVEAHYKYQKIVSQFFNKNVQ